MRVQDEKYTVDNLQDELFELMNRQINLLREILINMREEQQMLLENHTDNFKYTMEKREFLLKSLLKLRSKHTTIVQEIASLRGLENIKVGTEDESVLRQVIDLTGSSGSNIISMREQIIALNEDMQKQTLQNNYLLENKVNFTRELIRRLHPADHNPTYNTSGSYKGKTKNTTVTLINREV